MNTFAALNPLSRRYFKVPYVSPLICQLREEASGSAAGAVAVIDIEPTVRLAGPTLSFELQEDASVRLEWTNDVPNAYAYIVYRATSEGGPYSVVASGVVNRFFVDNPAPGTFFYKVTAIEPNYGETTASNVVTVTVS